jgi:hypothetical protein
MTFSMEIFHSDKQKKQTQSRKTNFQGKPVKLATVVNGLGTIINRE